MDLTLEESQTIQAELEAIRRAALCYIEAWYEGDPEKMESCLHPDLAKRTVRHDPDLGTDRLEPISALGLVIAARRGIGAHTPEAEQQKSVQIMDVFGNMASVKVVSTEMVDYLHLAKFFGKWVIVNALWTKK